MLGWFRSIQSVAVAACFVLAGCERSLPAADAGRGDATRLDAGVLTHRLSIEGSSSRTVAPQRSIEVAVRVRTLASDPAAGVRVQFALVGVTRGATLDALDRVSDADGLVRVAVTVGATATTFRVRVSASGAESREVEVSVGDSFGDIEVVFAPVVDARIRVRVGASDCAALDDSTASLIREVRDTPSLRFTGLPTSLHWSVEADAVTEVGAVVASGCVEGLVVPSGGTTVALVPWVPVPPRFAATYDIQLTLDASGPTAGADVVAAWEAERPFAERFLQAAAAFADAHADAAFRAQLVAERERLVAALGASGPSMLRVARDTDVVVDRTVLAGTLAPARADGLVWTHVRAGMALVGMPRLTSGSVRVAASTVALEGVRVPFAAGQHWRAVYEALGGPSRAREGCVEAGLGALGGRTCDAMCVSAICDDLAARDEVELTVAFASWDESLSELTFRAEGRGTDADHDGLAESIAGMGAGDWTGARPRPVTFELAATGAVR